MPGDTSQFGVYDMTYNPTDALVFFEAEQRHVLPSQVVENPQTIGEHLKNKQIELQITQNEMARRIGVDPENIINWKLRGRQPHITFYPKIIEFLGYNPVQVDTSTIAGRIKKYRIEHGLSQRAFAELSGLDESSICVWEKNEKQPLPSKRKILEEIFNTKELST
jgi:transcriptional regulator with XRE-family HTH domain